MCYSNFVIDECQKFTKGKRVIITGPSAREELINQYGTIVDPQAKINNGHIVVQIDSETEPTSIRVKDVILLEEINGDKENVG
jgi:hypothetical protein